MTSRSVHRNREWKCLVYNCLPNLRLFRRRPSLSSPDWFLSCRSTQVCNRIDRIHLATQRTDCPSYQASKDAQWCFCSLPRSAGAFEFRKQGHPQRRRQQCKILCLRTNASTGSWASPWNHREWSKSDWKKDDLRIRDLLSPNLTSSTDQGSTGNTSWRQRDYKILAPTPSQF